jgi:hypothetical protein
MDRSNPRLMIADNPYIVSGKLCIYTIYSVLCPKSIDWDLKAYLLIHLGEQH